MKQRVQMDTLLMVAAIMLTAFLYFFPKLSEAHITLQNILSFFGYTAILKGTFLRMSARGHKKAFSQRSHNLVTTGPYKIVRNPMYLGSFLIGAGFVLILWPWWGVPVFAWVFYTRFKRQIAYEEEILSRSFGSKYTAYCHLTPRVFPNFYSMMHVHMRDIFDFNEAFSTKEKLGLIGWPSLALVLQYCKQAFILHHVNLSLMLAVFVLAALTFVIGFVTLYYLK